MSISAAESAVPLVARHDNLLVVQTLSKSRALAGLRVGFAIGQRPLIEALERVKDSFNSYPLDSLAMAGAIAAIKDDAWFQDTRGAHHGEPRGAGARPHRPRLRGPAVSRELRVRPPSSAQRRRSRGPASRSTASSSGILRSRGSRTSCASPSVPDEQCARLIELAASSGLIPHEIVIRPAQSRE